MAAVLWAGVFLATAGAAPEDPAPDPDGKSGGGDPELLVEKVLEARGGLEGFGRLLEVRRHGTLTLATADGEISHSVRMTVRPPDRMIIETGEGAELSRRVIGPGEAYQASGDQEPVEMDREAAEHLRHLIFVDEAFLPRNVLGGLLEARGVEPAGPGQLPAGLAAAGGLAVLIEDSADLRYRLVVPDEGGLPLRVDYQSSGPDGEKRNVSDAFGAWGEVDGLLFPFEIMIFAGGQGRVMIKYESIEIDLAPVPPR
jgi:hypothetical protein